MKRKALCAVLAGAMISMAVYMPTPAAMRVYVIGGGACGNWEELFLKNDCCIQDFGTADEPEWFPGQGDAAVPERPDWQGGLNEPEWFPGQGDAAVPERPDWQGGLNEPEWFPGQGDAAEPEKPDYQDGWNEPGWFPWQGDTFVPQWPEDSQKPDAQLPDQNDNQMRAYINGVINLVNQERAAAGLVPVREDSKLTEAATIRAREIVSSFSHTRPNGGHFSTVLTQNGISYRGAGENIAYGYSTPQAVMNAWMNSAGHRANIMNGSYVNIGIGYYQSGDGTIYCTQLFTY